LHVLLAAPEPEFLLLFLAAPESNPDSNPLLPELLSADAHAQSREPPQPAAPGSVAGVPAADPPERAQADSQTDESSAADAPPLKPLLEAFNSSALRARVEVSVHPGSVNLEISDNILFAPASAALTVSGLALLQELAEALRAQPHPIAVEGHTDNIPIHTERFPSNWELSSARAAIVARYLIEQGISPERIRAVGYADTRPRADNLTPQGRARNRRVSFVLQIPAS
jgi:chemotaxis protein MotB